MTTDLHVIREQIVEMIAQRPLGSSSRFRLMDVAESLARAITAMEHDDGRDTSLDQKEA